MADCNLTMEGWEWDSIFTSSLLEQDITWHDALFEPGLIATDLRTTSSGTFANPELLLTVTHEGDSDSTPIATSAVIMTNISDGSLESSGYNNDTPVSSHHRPSETSLINPPAKNITKKKKRDPRLQCPNFLAGRIPCSCPEEDEFEEDAEVEALVKKRSKVAARCQVPSCGGDISHLKGYHQRHRVCLGCANSSEVMLKDQPHRYCQQCGKFHRLSDFDEGKRSCRRKLERHNRRRRRRPAEEEEEALDGEVPLLGNDINCSKMQSSPKEVALQDAQSAAVSAKQASRTQTAHTQLNKKGAPTNKERKTKAALNKQNSDKCLVDILQNQEDEQRTSDNSSGSVRRFKKEISSNSQSDEHVFLNQSDEHVFLHMLMSEVNEGAEQGTENVKQLHTLKSEATRASCSQRKCVEYVTPRPTGRISFKLYDWNPADFPRRLRQQIFEWLANMPVELETYVRSGCIILTFFVTMPQWMWDKVVMDWRGQVQKLILNSGVKLRGTAQLMTQMVEKSICLKDGKVTSAYCKDLLAPFLVGLYPHCLEAGRYTQIYVSGFNFSGARFLVSFGEYYVECSDWESVDTHHFTHRTLWNSVGNLEVYKVTVFLPDSKKFGPAYVEAESVHGVSNFLPVLVADKDVCSEINAFGASSAAVDHKINASHEEVAVPRSQYLMNIVTDLGWSLKYMNKGHQLVDKAEVRDALMNRLQSLITFSSEHCCHAVMQRLIQMAFTTVIAQQIHGIPGNSDHQSTRNISGSSKDLKDMLISGGIPYLNVRVEEGYFTSEKFAVLPKVDSGQAVDRPSQTKVLQGSKIAAQQLRLVLTSGQLEELDSSSSFLSSNGLTAIEVPLLEERIPMLEDGWRQNGCWTRPLSWPRKPRGATGTSLLSVGNRKFYRILIAAVGIVTVCTGMCAMLQHPHEVAEISMSLRRCLWGSSAEVQHV